MQDRTPPRNPLPPIAWAISDAPVPYAAAVSFMEQRASAIADGQAPEMVWLLEHPPLYTAGTSAKAEDLLVPDRFPVHRTGRGGQFTYHGPGQRIAYVMLNLRTRANGDIRAFVHALENWIIRALAAFNVRGEVRPDRVGIWVPRTELGEACEDKIAAIGIRVRRGISFHGVSLNVDPDLSHYLGINPCGITDQGVTSLLDLGRIVSMEEVDVALRQSFTIEFGPTATAAEPALESSVT